MAAEGKAIIFHPVIYFFYFVSIDERSAIRSQPNLASRSEVVTTYKCSPQFPVGPSSKNMGRKGHKILTTFSQLQRLAAIVEGPSFSGPAFSVPPLSAPPFAHCNSPFGGNYVATIS